MSHSARSVVPVSHEELAPPSQESLDSVASSVVEPFRMRKTKNAVHRVEKVPMGPNAPPERFSFCSVGIGDKYYIWGGRNNRNNFEVVENSMHIFDFRTNMWESVADEDYTISLTGAMPVVWNDKIFVWGGYSTKYHNDMHMFDPETKQWALVEQQGQKPQRRWHYSAAVHEDKMYMFGGTFDQTHHMDLHIFDFKKKEWTQSFGRNAPTRPRRRHRQVVWKNKLYIIGGKEDSDTASTMLVYDIQNDSWSEIDNTQVDTNRGLHIPSSHDHSLYLHGDEVYLFGAGKPHRVMKYYFNQKLWMPVVPTDYLRSGLWNIPSHHGNPAVWKGSVYFFGGRKISLDQEMTNNMYRFVIEEQNNFSSLAELLTQPRDFSNVQFLVAGKKIFADRCILWAKSEYFKKFFNSKFKDNLDEKVQLTINHCSYEVFYALIHFLYTNEKWSPDSWQETLSFLQQADKYQIKPIRQHCVQLLCSMVNLENVDTLWKAGEMYNLLELKEICLDFIVARYPAFCDAGKYDSLLSSRSKANFALIKAIAFRLADEMKRSPWRTSKSLININITEL